MLRHIVLITMKPDTAASVIASAIAALRALPASIDSIETYTVDRDLGLNAANATIAIVATYESVEKLEAYLVHPEHVRVVNELIKPFAASSVRAQIQL